MVPSRRQFVGVTSAATLGLANLADFGGPMNRANAAQPMPERIQFGAELEPIVRLIEDTPRERCVAALAEQLRRGMTYRQFLAAAFCATIRKRDSHHAVYQMMSVHQISMDLPQTERLLPLFWAVDGYKSQQARFATPAMPVLQGNLPAGEKAEAEFHAAMNSGDTDRAERAIVALARQTGPRAVHEILWLYGCRDGSLIGHRAISVSSCVRIMDTVGMQHVEPVLRFVARDLLLRGGGADQFYRTNGARADKLLPTLPPGWATGAADRGATQELFTPLREGRSEEACDLVVKQLPRVGARPIWDALHVAAAELLMVHDAVTGMNIRPLHVNTAVNALRHGFDTALSSRTRLLSLLQAAAWVADMIRVQLTGRKFANTRLSDLEGGKIAESTDETVREIFAALPPHIYVTEAKEGRSVGHNLVNRANRWEPSRRAFALLTRRPEAASAFMRSARSWLTIKATGDAHEYKLAAALFEDYERVSPEWRPRLLAASLHWFHGNQSPNANVLQQAREAVRKVES